MYERLRFIDGKHMQFSKCSKKYPSTVYLIVIYEKVPVSQLLSCPNPLEKLCNAYYNKFFGPPCKLIIFFSRYFLV